MRRAASGAVLVREIPRPLVKARDFGNDASLVLSLDLKGDNFNLDACTYGGHVDLKLKVLKD